MLSMGEPTEALSTTTLKQPGRTGLWGSVDTEREAREVVGSRGVIGKGWQKGGK